MDLSVIITNYHTRHLVEDCINSILVQTRGLQYEVVLVENGSAQFTAANHSWSTDIVRVYELEKNRGFAGGNNYGITKATGKYILLLNSDTYLQSNAFRKTFDYMERHPEAGVVSARLVYPDGRHQSAAQRFPSIRYQLIEFLRLQKLLPSKMAGRILLGFFFDHKENLEADWVWGTYFQFRREILNQLPGGKLDEGFHMYYEDMQWCMDIRRLGYEIHFCSDAEVVHIGGGSSSDKQRYMRENHEVFLKRNYGSVHRFFIKLLERLLSR